MFDIVVEVVQERERGRTYCINIQTTPFIKKRVYKQEKLYGHNNNNYLDEYMPIMCFDPRKITFLVMILFKFAQKPVGNLIFCITYFDNIALFLRKHPWN